MFRAVYGVQLEQPSVVRETYVAVRVEDYVHHVVQVQSWEVIYSTGDQLG
jgi:hypothetical protein